MDVAEARAALGVADGEGWEVVRAAYRRLIRAAHPDVTGDGATGAAARLNEAYAVLSRAKRSGTLYVPAPPIPATPATPPPPAPPPVGVAVEGTDTVLLAVPPPEAFALMLDAAHRVGSVSYVDRSCAIFEVVVRVGGEACSLVVTFQGRAHGTEAFLTLESLEQAASLSPEPVLREVVAALR